MKKAVKIYDRDEGINMFEELMKGTMTVPFIFSFNGLTDKTIWPYCPIPNANGIFIPGSDSRYKTIILFNYAVHQSGGALYSANILSDNSVIWNKYKTEQEMNNDLYYFPGDVEHVIWWGAGTVTTANREVYFSITSPKSMAKVKAITAEVSELEIRQNNVYIASGTEYKFKVVKNTTNIIRFCVEADTPFAGSNNDAVGLFINAKLTFS